jgi:hypothetical protein
MPCMQRGICQITPNTRAAHLLALAAGSALAACAISSPHVVSLAPPALQAWWRGNMLLRMTAVGVRGRVGELAAYRAAPAAAHSHTGVGAQQHADSRSPAYGHCHSARPCGRQTLRAG